MDSSGILNFEFFFNYFIEGMWDVALALAVIIISGSTFYLLFLILSISAWYFSSFRVIVLEENLSLQYVNSMNCILKLLLGIIGGFYW